MADADVLVLNHTLFFTLLSSDDEATPEDTNFIFPHDFVVIDEAHTIENIAAKQLGLHISESNIRFELGRLYNAKTKKGYFTMLGEDRGIHEVTNCYEDLEEFFRLAEAQCKFQGFAKEFRLRDPGFIQNTVGEALTRVMRIAQKAGDAAERENTKLELLDLAKRINKIRASIAAFIEQTEVGHVYWCEKVGGADFAKTLHFHSAPIDVSPMLEKIFFTGNKPCVLTSATLGVGDDQQLMYFRKRVGARKVVSACIESPFNYQKQMRLYLVKSMPEANAPTYQDTMSHWIAHFLEKSKGRAFVLFTSYTAMTGMAAILEDWCAERGYRLLVQGKGLQRHQMLSEFKKDTHSVLFGTDSFWAGVDVPGESLSNVIITRLPFAVPDHPLTASRLEHIESQGRNSFSEYSVPEAILKLRQGVGRLIRTRKDKGICVILDNRIITKPYGRAFLASMPDCPVEIVT